MIGQDGAPAGGQLLGQTLRLVAAGDIDDSRPRLLGDQRLELLGDAVARADVVAYVGPVEAGQDQPVFRNAELGAYGDGAGKIVFKGPGWISGSLVGFTINDSNMRSGPSSNAKVIARLEGDNGEGGVWGPDSFGVTRVYGCSGNFADVSGVTPTKKTYRGWVTKLCANQRTTCP